MQTTEPNTKRMTRQRQVVLEELRRVCNHPTADELFHQVRRRLPQISLATVYRNLDVLAREGSVRRLDAGSGPARYDGDLAPHYHVRCEACGHLEDMHEPVLATPELPQATEGGYQFTGVRLELLGICPACQTAARGAGGAG